MTRNGNKSVMKISANSHKRITAYAGIVLVIFIWGLYPISLDGYFYNHYSPSILSFLTALISGIVLLFICFPRLNTLIRLYFKIAIPTGFFNAAASLLQKIGLQYTTPTQYAFLENLSCVVVPVLLFIFIRKKPSVLTITASVLCLIGCFLLSGLNFSGNGVSFGTGTILCALAGVLYGVNIAATGAYAKEFYAPLYVMIQIFVQVIVSLITALMLNNICFNSVPIERLIFSWDLAKLLLVAISALAVSTLCWIIRTNAMKYVNASVVAVMMPFSAVVTGGCAVLIGSDTFTFNLALGGVIVIVASVLSSVGDIRESRKDKSEHREQKNRDTEYSGK